MREPPPPQLVALMERLGIATPGQIQHMEGRVRRLARDLPWFESVWVDALSQARLMTPFQAKEINAGRGDALRIGPYVLQRPVAACHYAACYRAERTRSRETVRLAVLGDRVAGAEPIFEQLQSLAARAASIACESIVPITDVGAEEGRIWAASPWIDGTSAAEWMVHHGRFPPDVVLEIGRAMLAGLVLLEERGLCHGDISVAGLLLTERGGVVLPQPGLRAIVRPEEGYAHADLRPEAYDALSPERVADGTPPTIASEVYACGCVWWHLLCGRPPLAGGDSLAKLRAAQAAAIGDLRQWTCDVPAPLAAAIATCLQRDPERRPQSIGQLASMLGPAQRQGRQKLARCLSASAGPIAPWLRPARSAGRGKRLPELLTAAAAGLILIAAVAWPLWRARTRPPAAVEAVEAPPRPAPAPHAKPEPPQKAGNKGPADLVLPSDRAIAAQSIRLIAGQCVRSEPGKRVRLLVPPGGMVVNTERVCFENVDFSPDSRLADARPQNDSEPNALVRLGAAEAEFDGCSFRSTPGSLRAPSAILWTHAPDSGQAALALPNGRVRLRNCVFHRVDAAVDCRTPGALAIEAANSLCLARGPLVRLARCPGADEPIRIALSRVTLRDGGPLVECDCGPGSSQPGEIAIEATGCVLSPRPGVPLLLVTAAESP